VQTNATRTCELLVGLREVTVLGVEERLRQPPEVCVDPQHPGSLCRDPQKAGALGRRRHIKVGHAPELPDWGRFHNRRLGSDGAAEEGWGAT